MTVAAASVPSWSWYSNTKVGRDTPILDLLDRPIRRICFSGCPFPLQDWRRYSHQLCVIAIVEASSMTKKQGCRSCRWWDEEWEQTLLLTAGTNSVPLAGLYLNHECSNRLVYWLYCLLMQLRPRPKVEGMVHLPAPPYTYKVVWYWQLDPSNEKTVCVCEVQWRGVLVMLW